MEIDINCLICHEPVRIPVRFICFDCPPSPAKQTCNDTIRVCLTCARAYLELDKPKNERIPQRKCLICPTTTEPRLLNADSAYAKDFLLMSMDSKKYPCVHSTDGCGFTGTQNDLDRHLRSECPYRILFCRGKNCKKIILAKDKETHRRYDCAGYRLCGMCDEVFRVQQFQDHLRTAHQYKDCQFCSNCEHPSKLQEHEQQCPQRYGVCRFCHHPIRFMDYPAHLEQHQAAIASLFKETHDASIIFRQEMERQNHQMMMYQDQYMLVEMEKNSIACLE